MLLLVGLFANMPPWVPTKSMSFLSFSFSLLFFGTNCNKEHVKKLARKNSLSMQVTFYLCIVPI